MPTHKKARLTVQLPATPCTPEMRDRIIEIADAQGVSLAEIQREALALFLDLIDRKSVNSARKSVKLAEDEEGVAA